MYGTHHRVPGDRAHLAKPTTSRSPRSCSTGTGSSRCAAAAPVRGDCVRVTPALFTSRDDVDLLATALRGIVSRMRG